MSTAPIAIASAKTTARLVGLLGKFIADENLAPGDRLPSIRQLAVQFGVKSGAVRSALLDELAPCLLEISWSVERHTQTDESHARLYSALVAGDVEVAQNEIRTHIQVAYKVLLDQVREPPEMPSRDARESK